MADYNIYRQGTTAADLNILRTGVSQVVRLGENTLAALCAAASASNNASSAQASATAAAVSAGFAEEFSGISYANTAAGVAATTVGMFFRVPIGTTPETYNRYERTATTPFYKLAAPLATTAQLASTAVGNGAGLIGLEQGGDVQDIAGLSRARMAATPAVAGQRCQLIEGLASGFFTAVSGISGATITADGGGRYIASATAGITWQRDYRAGQGISPGWWPNANPDGTTDNAVPLQKAADAAKGTGEAVVLDVPFLSPAWGTTQPIKLDYSTSVIGSGARTSIKALAGFPSTLSVSDPVGANKTVPAPMLLWNHNDAAVPGLVMNMSRNFRLNGNGIAPVGYMVCGGSNFVPDGIRIDGTTRSGQCFCGVQNPKIGKVNVYQGGLYGAEFYNGCYNGSVRGMDLRQHSVADIFATDNAAYPYYRYFTGAFGIREFLFEKGIWEDSLGGTGGAGKQHVVRIEYGQDNRFIGTQMHGKCTGAMIYDGANCIANIFQPSSMQGTAQTGVGGAAELRGYLSVLRDTNISLFGVSGGGSNPANLIEVYNFALISEVFFNNNNYYTSKIIANLSGSPDDVRRVSYVPRIKSGTKSARNTNTFADKIDAVTTYYETDTKRLAAYDPRSTVTNKWNDHPSGVSGVTNFSVEHASDGFSKITLANASAQNLTFLTGAALGQMLEFSFSDANTTIVHNTSQWILAGAVNVTPPAGAVMTFVKMPTSPFALKEIWRSF